MGAGDLAYQYLLGKVSTWLNMITKTIDPLYQYLLGKVSTPRVPEEPATPPSINIY